MPSGQKIPPWMSYYTPCYSLEQGSERKIHEDISPANREVSPPAKSIVYLEWGDGRVVSVKWLYRSHHPTHLFGFRWPDTKGLGAVWTSRRRRMMGSQGNFSLGKSRLLFRLILLGGYLLAPSFVKSTKRGCFQTSAFNSQRIQE